MPSLPILIRAMIPPIPPALAATAAAAEGIRGTFTDEAGHRRPVDRPFLTWRAYCSAPTTDAAAALPIDPAARLSDDPDVVLWSALTDPAIDIDAALTRFAHPDRPRTDSDAGALFPHLGSTPIEVWTETELSCLHALWWLAHQRSREDWAQLVNRVAAWHIENLQPDNATSHPWALHVFLTIAERDNNPDARLYAQTLLHNCQVALGHPDRFSVHILHDAADALEAMGPNAPTDS